MSLQFTYTRLLVPNFKECFLFYRDVMGFRPTFGTEDEIYADFDTGPTNLALFIQSGMSEAVGTGALPAQASAQDKVCLCFLVENVDETCQRLAAQGVDLVAPPTDRRDWGIRTAHFRDPAGNLIEINQSLDQ
jgi:catechol 2,3-dioxygenase-like lactoylglutathione lyase family enzyme